ncbi:uncharacterized protein LOC116298632 [Actinia tenebrosa]|uniref:Uncharacterized protein LOC116298632 n=1 Tax=Actinia tenebrosa TaxID=6105 RepID=A0A6P8I6P8_ACTTE|nr:uncharacterized protein LOC116298632 [Actinia tenebrosa]
MAAIVTDTINFEQEGDISRKTKLTNMTSLFFKTAVLSFLVFTTYLLFRIEREQTALNVKRGMALIKHRHGHGPPQMLHDSLYDIDDDDDDADEKDAAIFDVLPHRTSWSEWSRWSRCSSRKYCGEGNQYRKRTCILEDSKGFCTGVSMESRDCPDTSCVRDNHRTPGLADESPAAETSFIAQECNATTKYYARGKQAENIPQDVFNLYPSAKRLLTSGFFAVQEIPKVLSSEENITKVCFEPLGSWNLRSIRKAFHLNRYTKASIKNMNSNHLIGITIGLKPDGTLYGINVATGTPGAMYSIMYYRRFRGRSFHEDYLTF